MIVSSLYKMNRPQNQSARSSHSEMELEASLYLILSNSGNVKNLYKTDHGSKNLIVPPMSYIPANRG